MKKIILLLSILIVVAFYVKTRKPASNYLGNETLNLSGDADLLQAQKAAEHINNRNNSIRSITCNVFSTTRGTISSVGSMDYEKDRNFRMLLNSTHNTVFGVRNVPILDIGSNNDYFWFWSARMKPPAVYYADYKDVHHCRLKTPFHPLWMMESLSISKIDLEDAVVFRRGDKWIAYEIRLSTRGEQIIKGTLFDNNRILGHYIYSANGDLIVSSEVTRYREIAGHILPARIETIWYEEHLSIVWDLSSFVINPSISPSRWDMPAGEYIDIAN